MAGEEQKNPQVPGPSPEEERALSSAAGQEDSGTREAQQLSRGLSGKELKEEAAKREHDRSQKFKDHFERIAIWYLYGAALILFLAGVSLAWNMLAPDRWHYLSEEQVTKLQALFTGGVLVGVLSNHFKKRIG